jgi:hypothetical protein
LTGCCNHKTSKQQDLNEIALNEGGDINGDIQLSDNQQTILYFIRVDGETIRHIKAYNRQGNLLLKEEWLHKKRDKRY